jgi:hypothetical protein
VYPLDFLRFRLAVDLAAGPNSSSRAFDGALDCLRKTVVRGGVTALFQGYEATVLVG